MGRLIYSTICSLDGYVADRNGSFDFAFPSEEVVASINAEWRTACTHLFGRRTYELMTVWELDPAAADLSPESAVFAHAWPRLDKVVFSTTLGEATTSRTRVERSFDRDAVRGLVAEAAGDVLIGGPTIAAAALAAGLVEEAQLYLVPRTVGGGLPALPVDVPLELDLREQRRFADGTVLVRYGVFNEPAAPGVRSVPTLDPG